MMTKGEIKVINLEGPVGGQNAGCSGGGYDISRL